MADEPKAKTVCGLAYDTQKPRAPQYGAHKHMHTRFVVQGVNHRGGQPIRFKSLANAERHIRNMGLEK